MYYIRVKNASIFIYLIYNFIVEKIICNGMKLAYILSENLIYIS